MKGQRKVGQMNFQKATITRNISILYLWKARYKKVYLLSYNMGRDIQQLFRTWRRTRDTEAGTVPSIRAAA